jgi:hypothetical protein
MRIDFSSSILRSASASGECLVGPLYKSEHSIRCRTIERELRGLPSLLERYFWVAELGIGNGQRSVSRPAK